MKFSQEKLSLKNTFISKTINFYFRILIILEKLFMPLLVFFIRFWMARIFWYSGLTKISSWESTIFLFKDEYKVPVISAEVAAYIATAFELTCPILLILGFGARLATLPMLAMTAVIQFTYLDHMDHRYWAMLLAIILFYGPGTLSLDYFIKKRIGYSTKG